MRQTWTDGVCLSELCRLWMRHSCWGWSQEITGQVIKSDFGWGEKKSDFIRLKRKRKFQNREQRGKKTKKLNILIKFVIFVIFCNIIYFCFLFFFFAEFYFYYYFYLK